jgi:hypothetical protein
MRKKMGEGGRKRGPIVQERGPTPWLEASRRPAVTWPAAARAPCTVRPHFKFFILLFFWEDF